MSLCSNAWETRWQCAPNVLQMFSKCGPQCVPSNLPWKWFGGADQRPQFAELDNLSSRSWWGLGNKWKQSFELWKEKTWYISSGNFLMETFDLGTCAETRLRLHLTSGTLSSIFHRRLPPLWNCYNSHLCFLVHGDTSTKTTITTTRYKQCFPILILQANTMNLVQFEPPPLNIVTCLIAYSLNIWKDYFHEPILNYQSSTGKKLSA